MASQLELDKTFLRIAVEMSKLSHCVSHQVGCVLVHDNRIVATGINGTAKGFMNCDEKFPVYIKELERQEHYEWSLNHEIHAEMNVILFAARHGLKTDECTIYSTLEPCRQCIKNMTQSGIKRIVFIKKYDKSDYDYNEYKIPIEQIEDI